MFRFSAEFDFRTYDSEGVILYAESSDHSAWFLIALREGKIEIQFKNEKTTKMTTEKAEGLCWELMRVYFTIPFIVFILSTFSFIVQALGYIEKTD